MKKEKRNSKRKVPPSRKKQTDDRAKKHDSYRLDPVCWIVIPLIVVILLVLDALGIYVFNGERLVVLGIGLLVILLPFFSEITIQDLSIKCNKISPTQESPKTSVDVNKEENHVRK